MQEDERRRNHHCAFQNELWIFSWLSVIKRGDERLPSPGLENGFSYTHTNALKQHKVSGNSWGAYIQERSLTVFLPPSRCLGRVVSKTLGEQLDHPPLLVLGRLWPEGVGEGNDTALPYSCLEKSRGRRSLVGCSPWGRLELDTTDRLHFHFSLSCIGEGNGNPLQCSCLENPGDGGDWWAAVYGGHTESDTTETT